VGATKDWENGDLVAEVPPKEGEEVAEVLLAKAETIYPQLGIGGSSGCAWG
jgi:hypothetical protein